MYAGTASAQLDEIIVTASSARRTCRTRRSRSRPSTPRCSRRAARRTSSTSRAGAERHADAGRPGDGRRDDHVHPRRRPNRLQLRARARRRHVRRRRLLLRRLTGSMVELLDLDRVEIAARPARHARRQELDRRRREDVLRQPSTAANRHRPSCAVGDYDRVAINGAADLTFVEDKLSARISGVSSSRNGYVTRVDYKCTHPTGPARRSRMAGSTTASSAISAARASRAADLRCSGRRRTPSASRCSAT